MPDIFDKVSTKSDIFDRVAPKDIFDKVSTGPTLPQNPKADKFYKDFPLAKELGIVTGATKEEPQPKPFVDPSNTSPGPTDVPSYIGALDTPTLLNVLRNSTPKGASTDYVDEIAKHIGKNATVRTFARETATDNVLRGMVEARGGKDYLDKLDKTDFRGGIFDFVTDKLGITNEKTSQRSFKRDLMQSYIKENELITNLSQQGMSPAEIVRELDKIQLETPSFNPPMVVSAVFGGGLVQGLGLSTAVANAILAGMSDIPISKIYDVLAPNHPVLASATAIALGLYSGKYEQKTADRLTKILGPSKSKQIINTIKAHVDGLPFDVQDMFRPSTTSIVKSNVPPTGFEIVTKPKTIRRPDKFPSHFQKIPDIQVVTKENVKTEIGKLVYKYAFRTRKGAIKKAKELTSATGKRIIPVQQEDGKIFLHEVKTKRVVEFGKPEPIANNASGDSEFSLETQARIQSEESKGITYSKVDTKSHKVSKLSNITGRTGKLNPNEIRVKVQDGKVEIMDRGANASKIETERVQSIYNKVHGFVKTLAKDETGSIFLGGRKPKKPLYAPETPEAHKASSAFAKSHADAEAKNLNKPSPHKILKALGRGFVDISGNLKNKLFYMGATGREVATRFNLIHGAAPKANYIIRAATDKIYGGLAEDRHILFDEFAFHKRITSLEQQKVGSKVLGKVYTRMASAEKAAQAYTQAHGVKVVPSVEGDSIFLRRMEGIKHPHGVKASDSMAWLKGLKAKDPELYTDLNRRFQIYSDTMKDVVKLLREDGLISETEELNLLKGDYVKRKVLDYADPQEYSTIGPRGASVTDSGLHPIKEGTFKSIETDTLKLMQETVARAVNRGLRNKANIALVDLARENPDNGIVKLNKVIGRIKSGIHAGEPKWASAPPGFKKVRAFEDGKKIELLMPKEFHKEWVIADPAMSRPVANILQWISGTKILKAMATGYNPGFAITNSFRDMALIYLSDYNKVYSKYLPGFIGQMGKDVTEVIKDSIKAGGFKKTQLYKDYIMNGGGMEFLSAQGRGAYGKNVVLNKTKAALSVINETSEIMTRLAYMKRGLRNGLSIEEATNLARSYVDFSNGGNISKAMDNFVPYFNASIQGTRGAIRASRRNPKLFAAKVAQIGALSMGLTYLNYFRNKEALKEVNPTDKINYFVIPFGNNNNFVDKTGVKRWMYIKLAKDQTQRLISQVFESIALKTMGEKVDVAATVKAASELLSITPNSLLPPTFKAMLEYTANYDFWRQEAIWKGDPDIQGYAQSTRYTSPILKKIGEATHVGGFGGLSPEKLRAALSAVFTSGNLYTSMMGHGVERIIGEVPQRYKDYVWEQQLAKEPLVKRVINVTDPVYRTGKLSKQIRKETKTERFIIGKEFDDLVFKQLRGEATRAEVLKAIRIAPRREKRRLRDRYIIARKTFRIPNRRFWLDLRATPAKGRAKRYFIEWQQKSPEEQKKMDKLVRTLPGIRSPEFFITLRKFKNGELKVDK